MVTKEEAKTKMLGIANYLHMEAKADPGKFGDALDILRYLEGSKENTDAIAKHEHPLSDNTVNRLARYKPSVQSITVLEYLSENGSITTDGAMNLLGLSQARVSSIFRDLVSLDIVSYGRDSRQNRYIIKDNDLFEAVLKEYGGFSNYKSAEESSKPI